MFTPLLDSSAWVRILDGEVAASAFTPANFGTIPKIMAALSAKLTRRVFKVYLDFTFRTSLHRIIKIGTVNSSYSDNFTYHILTYITRMSNSRE